MGRNCETIIRTSLYILFCLLQANYMDANENDQYDILLKNGTNFNNYEIIDNNNKNSSLTITDGNVTMTIDKSEIKSVENSNIVIDKELVKINKNKIIAKRNKDNCENDFIPISDENSLREMKNYLNDKVIKLLQNKRSANYTSSSVENEFLLKKCENRLEEVKKALKMKMNSDSIKRGVDAQFQIDRGEWKTASDLENLIKEKVEMDMILNK
jgi:hypothetical protein